MYCDFWKDGGIDFLWFYFPLSVASVAHVAHLGLSQSKTNSEQVFLYWLHAYIRNDIFSKVNLVQAAGYALEIIQ